MHLPPADTPGDGTSVVTIVTYCVTPPIKFSSTNFQIVTAFKYLVVMAADQKREHKPRRESSKHQFYFNILAHQTEDSPSFHCQFCGRCYCRNLGNLDILSSRYILSLRSLYHQIYSPFKMSYVLFFLPSVVTRTYFRSKHGCS